VICRTCNQLHLKVSFFLGNEHRTDMAENSLRGTSQGVPVGIMFSEGVFADEIDAVHVMEYLDECNVAVALSGGPLGGVAEAMHLLRAQQDETAFVRR